MSGGAALVTGGSRGIGLAVAKALSSDGYDLTLVARSAEALGVAAASVPGRAEVVPADLSQPDVAAGIVAAHLAAHGRLDVLVLAAGMARAGDVAGTSASGLRRLLAANVESSFALVGAALPALRQHRGLVVAVASISGVLPEPGFAAYSASKAALRSMARSIAVEEAEHGVRACAICPAYVDTAMTEVVPLDAEAMLRPADVAEAVRFLLRLSPTAVVDELVLGRAGAGLLHP